MSEEPLPPYGSPSPAPTPDKQLSHEPSPAANRAPTPVPPNEQHITLLGGLRRSGPWSVPRQVSVVCLIGGVHLDLRDADLPAGEVVLQHFSLVGGVHVIAPEHVGIRIDGLRLIGGQSVEGTSGPTTTTLVIRSFGVLGGIRVRRR